MEEKSKSLLEESTTFHPAGLLSFLESNIRKIISITIGIFVVLFVLFIIFAIAKRNVPFKTTENITINKHVFKVKVANSDADKEIGLSQTKSLPSEYAMLFSFKQEGYYSFWMRDMKYPIDIIYINQNKIVQIFQDIPQPKNTNEPLKIYVSNMPADSVLEIKAGLSKKYNLKQGDAITTQNTK